MNTYKVTKNIGHDRMWIKVTNVKKNAFAQINISRSGIRVKNNPSMRPIMDQMIAVIDKDDIGYGQMFDQIEAMFSTTGAQVAPAKKSSGSKLDMCREQFRPSLGRQENIKAFMVIAGCTEAGAATYYAKIKKES